MTIKQQGGVFGRNPIFNDVEVNDLTANDVTTGALDVNGTGLIDTLGVGTPSPQKPFVVSDNGNIGLEVSPNDAAQGYTRVLNYNRVAGQYEPLRFEGQSHRFYTGTAGSTLAGEFNASGNLAFQSGNGIDFSATAGTGTSELFDDYEEGTFTPSLGGTTSDPTISYTIQTGKYTKIGRLVYCEITIIISSFSGGSGNLQLEGLPFASDGDDDRGCLYVGFSASWASGVISGFSNTSATTVSLRKFDANNNQNTPVPVTDASGDEYLRCCITYHAA
jgi:hypothetical protein